jgi:hypothetical protein
MEVASSTREGVDTVFNIASDVGNLRNPFESLAALAPDPGLRMHGTYAGTGGFEIEFYPRSAVVRCGQVIEARDYSVSASGGRVLVSVQNGASPITLDLQSNGTMSGSGSITVEGRLLAGINVKDQAVFRAVTDSCTPGVITPVRPGN